MTRVPLLLLPLLLLLLSPATAGEDADLVFENEVPRRLIENDVEDIIVDVEDTGFGGRILKLKDQLIKGMLDLNIFASSTPPPVVEKESTPPLKPGDNDFIFKKIDPAIQNFHRRIKRQSSMGDDEDENQLDYGSTYGSGDEDHNQERKELTIRVSFVVREPYQDQFSNRDSLPFQNLSRNLADGVNELFDRLPGEQRARLVRIQSRPEDIYTCKVTLEIQTVYFYDTNRIQDFLRRHIRDTNRLGKVIVSDDEFSYQQFDGVPTPTEECPAGEVPCHSGECVLSSKRCNGVRDCSDNSDEIDCPQFGNEVDTSGFTSTPAEAVTETVTEEDRRYNTGLQNATPRGSGVNTQEPTEKTETEAQPEEPTTLGLGCSREEQVRCTNGLTYICRDQWCDGVNDCPDGTDESNCASGSDCQDDEMVCDVSRCIPINSRCDGIPDCVDGADERDCASYCKETDFVCNDGKCVESFRRCNRVVDCKGSEDEMNCPCMNDEFQCSDGVCVEKRKVCDGVPNCRDGGDERNCRNIDYRCDGDSFKCSDGSCISSAMQCDGVEQCESGEDERNCPVPTGQCDIRCGDGSCVDIYKRCDRIPDCNDHADERDCGPCPNDEFRCESGNCISGDRRCDGISDCDDQSDEMDCEATDRPHECGPQDFQCLDDGLCIREDFRCDGVNDCGDSSDERNCPTTQGSCGSDSVWCDGNCLDPSKICNGVRECRNGEDEANCDIEPSSECTDTEHRCSDGSCIDFHLVCNRQDDCSDGGDEVDCDIPGCSFNDWQCTSGECVARALLCNGREDCPDGSDERLPSCRPTSTEAPRTRPPITRPPYTRPPPSETTSPPPKWGNNNNDYYDERCRQGEWRCENGPCIPTVLRCNGIVNCPYDNSDELDCPTSGTLDLKTYPNDQIIRQSGEVVFQCRDEGRIRAKVKWTREGGRPLPAGSSDTNGRLEMPNIQVSDSGTYICRAVDVPAYTAGSEISVQLTVEPYNRIEHRPQESCKTYEATCSNGQCIPKSSVCNGNFDCTDGSDEMACNVGGVCEPNEFKCANKRCVLKTWLCDSEDDCKDGSDEQQCDQGRPGAPCRPHEFQCRTGRQCVPRSFHCDGEKDCLDGSDEVGCSPVYISRPPPPLMILSEYSTLVITCVAIGIPTPQVVWRLNWGHIPPKCSYTSVDGVGTLTCPEVRKEDQGAYSCEALNNRGSVFAVPDTILVINGTESGVCPAGYFNNEARVAQDCITCFCFGATSQCKSADLFTYQLPPPLNRGSRLAGVIQPAGQPLQITDEPISDIFEMTPEYSGATITRIGQWSPRNIYPYLALPEAYHGSQLTSYGGYIKYTVQPHGAHSPPAGYSPLPDIIIKGGRNLLSHSVEPNSRRSQNNISVRLFQGQWNKVTPYGPQTASREDIMMVLANVEAILLRGEENGSGVEIKNFQMDSAGLANMGQGSASFVEECSCPQGYSGLSCQTCSPGYSRSESGRWLGRCVREEESCRPGEYGNPSGGVPCRVCPCPLTTPSNQFSRTCQLESDGQVTCNCPSGYQGRRCETCATGYIGNPTIPGDSCRPAPPPSAYCDQRGTASQDGNTCRCKPHVVGSRCNECAPESFHLSYDNIFGCAQCFCMEVTRNCTSSQWRWELINAKFGSQASAQSVQLLEWYGQPDNIRTIPSNELRTDSAKQEISYDRFESDQPSTYYWSLPDRFVGDRITSYGGYLNYTIRHEAGENLSPVNNAPDVQLISKNDITLVHYNGATPEPNGYLTESVQFMEQYWQRSDGKQADREHILMALADLESILVKATYAEGTQRAALVAASLQVADPRGTGERASQVEQCKCPEGYLGTSCQDCAPGFTRGLDGLYLGSCERCSCNGHADQCHPETGECLNCQHNTEGAACEECAPGYTGDATIGTPGDCMDQSYDRLQCRCDARGSLAPFCVGGSTTCRCKQNVEGERCEQCRSGSFKLDESNPWGCSECFCSGVSNQCNEAWHLYRLQIPIAIFDDSHGFTLTTVNQDTVIDSNFQLNVSMNQIGYGFSGRTQAPRLFWSLPSLFTGNKVTSYGGQITVTQMFETFDGRQEYATDDTDVVLVGKSLSIYWKNQERLLAGTPLTFSVPLTEFEWRTLSTGEAPRYVERNEFLSILSDLQQVLVRATFVPQITHTYIADIVMDTAVPAETGQPLAQNIELCRCPTGYSGTSCETCLPDHYRTLSGACERCPCSGREEACYFRDDSVVCQCKPGYTGSDCSSINYENTTQTTSARPPYAQPTITVEIAAPTVENKPIGGSVQFICTARSAYSSSPLRVTWSRERGNLPLGRYIEDASRGVLSIRDLKVTDSGTYICQANDGISTAIDRATLTVPRNQVTHPEVTISGTVEVYEGEPIELLCDATGTPTPTLTWARANRRPLNNLHTFVNGIFKISSVRSSDQGEYKCTATNPAGQDSKTTIIYVTQRPESQPRQPVLSINPASPVVKEGDSLTLVCAADPSIPANLITWSRYNGYLPTNFLSTNGQLWMEAVRPEDAGVYRCSADRSPQRVLAVDVEVHVQRATRPPQVQGHVSVDQERSTVPEGHSLTIKCEPRGNPLPIIKWTKDGSEFGPGVSQRGNALVISQARISDRGIYICIGSTLDGQTIAQETAVIEVERREAPSVMVWPDGVQTVRPGSSVRLQCRVLQGAPEPVLTWSRPSGRPLSPNTHLQPDGILSFSSISINEEGVYTCTGSNLAGEGSANATIKIHMPPVLNIYPESYITATPGKDVVVECRATGFPEPVAYWKKVDPEQRQIGPESIGTAILTLSAIEEVDEGTYACVARNDAGFHEEQIIVSVQDNDIDSEPIRGDISGPVSARVFIPANDRNVSVRVGNSIRIDCKGTQSVTQFVWTKINSRVFLTTEPYDSGSILVLTNIGPQDSGTYRCEGYDRNNVPTSSDELTLNIIPDPVPNYVPVIPARPSLVDREPQRDQPEVHSARLGSNVRMPCRTELPPPVTFHWGRPYAQLPQGVQTSSPTLELRSITENDAGPYVCRVGSRSGQMESSIILKVTHVVPRFSGNGFIALDKMKDAYLYFDIEVVIKPQDYNGIILYNSEKAAPIGDLVSLSLVNGIPEFRFDLASGSVTTIRGDQPLTLDEWHKIKITRSRKNGFMYVDGKGPFSGSATTRSLGLDLFQPLYIGGVPDYNQLPENFVPRTGFVGCVAKLVLEDTEVSLMSESKSKRNTYECDSCTPNMCQNNAVCQESLSERGYSCLCADGFSGLNCNRTGDACRPGLCGPGQCKDTEKGFSCHCPIGYSGQRCEKKLEINYPAFSDGSYLSFSAPMTMLHLNVSLRIKPSNPIRDGIILYCAESRYGHGDYISLTLKNGYLEFRYDAGGAGSNIIRSRKPLNPDEWITVNVGRVTNRVKLLVEGQEPLNGTIQGKTVHMYLNTPLYIGGYDSDRLTINKGVGVDVGFSGCITNVKLSDKALDISHSLLKSVNVRECGVNETESRSHRGDIPEVGPTYQSESEDVCRWCQNGGYCQQPGDTRCVCRPGYHGVHCEQSIPTLPQFSPCERLPCENGGTCRPTGQGAHYKCDCPLGTGGFQCRQRVELGDDVSLTGEGYVELPSSLLPHDDLYASELIAIAFTTSSPDGLLVLQREEGPNFKDGDFIMLSINGGYVELQLELGGGVGTVRNTRVLVSDNQRHQVVVKRNNSEVTLDVDNNEDHGKAPGITQILNVDSNIYVGGVPSNMTSFGLIGFTGCIHQIEFINPVAVNFGARAVASRNANPCSSY